jgi:transcriptional regulator with XRE-family HTH domain
MPKQEIRNHRIKEAREAAGLPQYVLARRSGVTQPFISQIEAGLKNPTGLTLQKLALALDFGTVTSGPNPADLRICAVWKD